MKLPKFKIGHYNAADFPFKFVPESSDCPPARHAGSQRMALPARLGLAAVGKTQ
ncbi:MAG: hypothetical protein IT521_12460 [Burkholderiales bacterium]|nr:hypothetical protein [Burkholderiales bacterium]